MIPRRLKITARLSAGRRASSLARPVFLAAGVFDGVHLGHRAIIDRAVSCARSARGEAWVLTFVRHPATVLSPGKAPPMLTCTGHKLMLLERAGVHGCVLLPFTKKLASQEPAEFARRLLAGIPSLCRILVGANWRFGRGGSGDPSVMRRLLAGTGVDVDVVPSVMHKARAVSSSRIREAALAGRLDEAAAMLGRPFSLLGTVRKGRGIGRKIGFPTANLSCHGEVIPPDGIYAARVLLNGRPRSAVLYIGSRPTFAKKGAAARAVELHIPGFKGDLYGRELEVVPGPRLRGDMRFDSVEALVRQIRLDIENSKNRRTK